MLFSRQSLQGNESGFIVKIRRIKAVTPDHGSQHDTGTQEHQVFDNVMPFERQRIAKELKNLFGKEKNRIFPKDHIPQE